MMMNANRTLSKTLFNDRITPELSADDVWGEVRSLVQGELSGGEQWSEWSELFTRRPLRDEHFLYIQNAWKPPVQVTDMRSLRRAFELRVLVANERAHKEANLARFNPPATIERLEKWRQRSSTALPPYLRACLLELGDGMRPGERGESSISPCLEEHGPGIMAMRSFTEHMDYVRADGVTRPRTRSASSCWGCSNFSIPWTPLMWFESNPRDHAIPSSCSRWASSSSWVFMTIRVIGTHRVMCSRS